MAAVIKRNATAGWSGSGKDGRGALTTQSGTLKDMPTKSHFNDGEYQVGWQQHLTDRLASLMCSP